MAEFIKHTDQITKTTILILKADSPDYETARPFTVKCRQCPINAQQIADGCTMMGYNTYSSDIRASMRNEIDSGCLLMGDPSNIVEQRAGNYDSLMSTYGDKEELRRQRAKVKEVLKALSRKN